MSTLIRFCYDSTKTDVLPKKTNGQEATTERENIGLDDMLCLTSGHTGSKIQIILVERGREREKERGTERERRTDAQTDR